MSTGQPQLDEVATGCGERAGLFLFRRRRRCRHRHTSPACSLRSCPATTDGLVLQLGPKEVELVGSTGSQPVFSKTTKGGFRRRGALEPALAALQDSGAISCRLLDVRLLPAGGSQDGGDEDSEQLHVLAGVTLLPPFFQAEEGSEVCGCEAG